jgi:protein-S-isoprenylcysteine O-methyltransferase Ste14
MKINVNLLIGQSVGFFVLVALCLFLPAGTVAWLAGWTFLVLFFSWFVGMNVWLYKNNPELLKERMSLTRSDQKGWDKVIFPLLLIFPVATLVFISFDATRFHWSPLPNWLQAFGVVALLCSFVLFFLTFRENTYLSTVVRIQKDRGHKVVSTGPYHYVRHPMYLGFVILQFGTPLLLGSGYGVLIGLVFAVFLARRTVMEENALRQELDGYKAYMQQVKYRFIPFVW